jgi:tetratricopeptide (TPR) repeat protein
VSEVLKAKRPTVEMAKTKTKSHSRSKSSSKPDSILHATDAHVKSTRPSRSIEELLTEAASLLEQSQPESALPLAEEALRRLEAERQAEQEQTLDDLLQLTAQGKPTLPTTLALAAEVHLALGDAQSARDRFEKAVTIDPDGALVSADPWLWLAQLCEEGGKASIAFFERGCDVLRNEIEVLQESMTVEDEEGTKILDERRSKLADALCGMTEVYMTDLSWETDAEQRCEALVTEAVAVCPERMSAGALQTLASVRISQERVDDAKAALKSSLAIWKDIPSEVEDEARPDFATRVSLSRLLMEVECEADALAVLEGLVKEDDQSVECWYLGGWCQVLMSGKQEAKRDKLLEQAKVWIDNCLRLYKVQEYEDDRLQEHALELKQKLNKQLGLADDDDAWEDEDDEDLDGEDLEIEDEVNGHVKDADVEMT